MYTHSPPLVGLGVFGRLVGLGVSGRLVEQGVLGRLVERGVLGPLVVGPRVGGEGVFGGVYPPSDLATAEISGYFPWLHLVPVKSSRSRHQNMAPAKPLAV